MSWNTANWTWLFIKIVRFVLTLLAEASSYEEANNGGVLSNLAAHEKDQHTGKA